MSVRRHARCAALAATCSGFVLLCLPARTGAADLYGYLQEGIGVTTGDGDVIFHRQTLNIKAQEKFAKKLTLRFETDFWVDSPDFQATEMRSRIREGYAKLRFEKFDVRAGRVQVAWGEADGVIVSDQVSPFDLENFIVPEFDEIRMGVDGIFIDYYPSWRSSLQAFWIYHFTSPDFPDRRSPWSVLDEDQLQRQLEQQAPPGTPPADLTIAPIDRPSNKPSNFEWGTRWSSQAKAVDWQVGYLYSWDDRPHVRLRVTGFDPGTVPPTVLLEGRPRHNRFHLFTGSFVVPVKAALFRMDTVLEYGRFLQLDPADPRAAGRTDQGFVTEENVSRTLFALDFKPTFSWWHQPDASLQFIHESVIDPHPALLTAEHTDHVSLRLQAAYLNETVKPWVFAIANVRGDDMWVQAKVDYEPFDHWRFTLEYDWFYGHDYDGDSGGIYGRFDDNDMFLFLVRFSY